MQTQVVKITNIKAQKHMLEEAGAIIRRGGLVAFPTETVYGLGANGLDGLACKGIYAAKGRPSDNPLILHVASRHMIGAIAAEVTPLAEKLLAAFCPGPITLIMKRKPSVPDEITGGLPTVGIRMPESDVARAFIKAAGVPVAAPSANISGRPSPTTAEAVLHDLEGRVPLILDGGPCHFGVESTIVDCTGEIATVLRPGAVTLEMLKSALGNAKLDPAIATAHDEGIAPRAPGMKYRHYAPRAPLTLITGEPRQLAPAFRRASAEADTTVGIIVSRELSEELADFIPKQLVAVYGARDDFSTIAAKLYDSLMYFDDTETEVLFAEGVREEGLGLAIMNRLRKASGGRIIFCRS